MGKISRRDNVNTTTPATTSTPSTRSAQKKPTATPPLPAPPEGWADLPVLSHVLDYLSDPKDIACAAMTCKAWRNEAARDHRWKAAWAQEVSDHGLWRWAKADGGYREQLRAKAVISKGDVVATTFPFNRRDGSVSEILMLDAGSNTRIVTVQHRRLPQQTVRLQGATIKVWCTQTLKTQRPLRVVHDVIKHLQLEDGRLFMWRIADDAFIRSRCLGDATEEEEEEARRWAEHPSIVASVLDPITLQIIDSPLDSSYGRGSAPHEWMDLCSGSVASGAVCPATQTLSIRLLDLTTGICFRESSCAMPAVAGALPLHPEAATVLLSRNSDVDHQVLAAAALFDCRVFRWRLKDAWLTPEARKTASTDVQDEGEVEEIVDANNNNNINAQQQQQQQQQGNGAGDAGAVQNNNINPQQPLPALEALAAVAYAAAQPPPPPPPEFDEDDDDDDDAGEGVDQGPAAGNAPRAANEYVLHHVFTTYESEPIVDLSISTAARRIYVLGLENLFVLNEEGALKLRCSMSSWRGARSPFDAGAFDVGAFSWPLPNSSRAAIYLDACNSVYLTDFQPTTLSDFWLMKNRGASAELGRYPPLDRAYGWARDLPEAFPVGDIFPDGHGGSSMAFTVQSHVDLRPPPRSHQQNNTSTGRFTRPSDNEQVIVEYNQSGSVLFTGGDSSCPATAALLRAEKAAGTYLTNVGPDAVAKVSGKASLPVVSRQGNGGGPRAPIAPRALVCIHPNTGRRFKAIPIEGSLESVHSSGHYLAVAVGPVVGESYNPDGLNGAIVVFDFTQQGFGLSTKEQQKSAGASSSEKKTSQQQQQQQQHQQAAETPTQTQQRAKRRIVRVKRTTKTKVTAGAAGGAGPSGSGARTPRNGRGRGKLLD